MQEIKRSKVRKPWLATILCLFTGPFGLFYFGWRSGLIGWLIFISVSYMFRFKVSPKFATPPWIELFLPVIWAYAGWRYAKSWNVQTEKLGLNFYGSYDAGIVATTYVVWLNILVSLPVVAIFTAVYKFIDGEISKGIFLGLAWIIGSLLWYFLVGRLIIIPWTQEVNYLHLKKRTFSDTSLDIEKGIKSGNDPLAISVLSLFFSGFAYLYFNWKYAVLAIGLFLVTIFIVVFLDFFDLLQFIPDWYKWTFSLVFAWKGFQIAVTRRATLELGESTLEEMNSWPFAGMATSILVEALGMYYAFSMTLWEAIELLSNHRIFFGIIILVIGVPLATYLANLIFGFLGLLIFSLFRAGYEYNIFRERR